MMMIDMHMLNDVDDAVGEMARRRVVEERQRRKARRKGVEEERQSSSATIRMAIHMLKDEDDAVGENKEEGDGAEATETGTEEGRRRGKWR